MLNIREPSLPYIPHGKFGLLTGYIFVINTCIGAGFLSIPWAFDNAGWLFCVIYQIIVSIQGYFMCMMILEAMSRAEILLRMTEEGKDIHQIALRKLFSKPIAQERLIQPPHLRPIITNRMINCSDIVKLVFGERTGMVYLILFYFYQLGTLVAFISIFSSSFASNVPLGNEETCDIYATSSFYNDCRWKYWVYLAVYSIITVYMTMKGIEEQQAFQFTMSILRFSVMLLIILISIVDLTSEKNNQDSGHNSLTWPPLVNPLNIGHAIPIIFFASNFQLQMPTLIESINNKAYNLPRISILALMTCFVLYTSMGLLVSVTVDSVPSMASLAYRHYTAGYSASDRPFWTYIAEYLIVLTPAIDVISAYPIQALSMADALTTWKFGGEIAEIPNRVKYFIRFIIAFLPFFIAFFEFNLGTILDWNGLTGFFLTQLTIPLIHIAMRHMVAGESPYDINVHPIVSWITIGANLMLFFLVIGMNLAEY